MSFLSKVKIVAEKEQHPLFKDMPASLKQVLHRDDDFYNLDYKENPAKIVLKDPEITGVVLYDPGSYFEASKSYFAFQLKNNRIIWDRDYTMSSNYASWGVRKISSQPVMDWILDLRVYPKTVKYSDYLKSKKFLEPYL